MNPRTRPPLRVQPLAAALVAACALARANNWAPTTPADLSRDPSRQATEAQFILRDRTEVTLAYPRLDGANVQGTGVSSCAGDRCDEIRRTQAVETRHIAWMAARYASLDPSNERAAAASATASTPSTARARSRAMATPVLRLDLTATLGGIMPMGATTYGGNPAIGLEARMLGARGFGGSVAILAAGSVSFDLFGRDARSPSVEMFALDLSALYRARVEGDERRNTGAYLGAGLSFTSFDGDPGHAAATCGFISWSCTEPVYTPPPQNFSDGWRVVPVIRAGVDERVSHFLVGLGVTWRADFAERGSMQALSLGLNVGASFW